MRFQIREKIKELENQIFKGYKLWIFKGYVALDKRGVVKIIDEIYSTLPEDVMEARTYLKNHNVSIDNKNESHIYDVLRNLEIMLDKACFFFPFTIVNKKEIEQIKSDLAKSIPQEINEAEKIDK